MDTYGGVLLVYFIYPFYPYCTLNAIRERVEVVFLQETYLSDTEHAKLKRLGFKHQYSSSYMAGHRRVVAILISNKTSFKPIFEKKTQREDLFS